MAETLYSTDGKGHWVKMVFRSQCRHKVLFADQCQAAYGHDGPCWAYAPDGSYCEEINNRKLDKFDARASMTPPGHKRYVNPIDKQGDRYLSKYERTEVTSKRLIARLERGEIKENESINSPLEA